MTYIDYRHKLEFGVEEYAAIDRHCRDRGILWFASCWDEEAVDFMEQFDPAGLQGGLGLAHRPRAAPEDEGHRPAADPLHRHVDLGRGRRAASRRWGPTACSSPTPSRPNPARSTSSTSRSSRPSRSAGPRCRSATRATRPDCPTWAAVAIGATYIERHITLDRAMWGSDQAASVEVGGFVRLVTGIRDIEASLGDGVKRLHDSERRRRRSFAGPDRPAGGRPDRSTLSCSGSLAAQQPAIRAGQPVSDSDGVAAPAFGSPGRGARALPQQTSVIERILCASRPGSCDRAVEGAAASGSC